MNNERDTTRLLLSIAAILTIVSTLILAGVIGKGVYDYFRSKSENGKIAVVNVDPKYTQDLTSQLVYTGSSTGTEQYYSASIDAVFTLDKGLFNVIENTKQIAVYPKSYINTTFYNSITVNDFRIDYISVYKSDLGKLYPDIKIEEEGTVESLNYFKVSYTKKDFFDPSIKTLVNEMIIYRVIDKKIVLARTAYPTDFDINQYSSGLAKLMNTIQLSPKNITTKAVVQIKNADMELSYDRKKFDLSSNTDYSAFLAYRSEDNETNSSYKYITQTFSVNTSSIGQSSTVLGTLKEWRNFDQSLYNDKNFTVIKDNYKLLVNGREFIATDYSYDGFNKTQLITLAVGKAPFSTNYVILKAGTLETKSNGYKDTLDLFNGITFKNLTATQSTVYPKTISNVDKVLGTSTIDIDKSAIIGKPGVVHIYTRACVDVTVKQSPGLGISGGKKYTDCYGLLGSGFFVSSNGYIATNGHVAIPNAYDLLSNDLTQGSQLTLFWHDILLDGLASLKAQGYNTSGMSVNDLIIVGLRFSKFLMDNGDLTLTPTYQNYIEGEAPFAIDASTLNVSNGTSVKFVDGQVDSSTLIALSAASNKPTGITKPDVAILKLDGGNDYPALSLADSSIVTAGEKIQVIGFPGSANNSSLFGADTSRIATITNGTISAIKNNSTNAFKLLQIDASISHGNSGGPILNSDGQVVGIATYKINGDESADFNAGVSVQEISNILKKNNIALTTGTTSQNISSGIDNFSKSYYKLAVTNFNDAVKSYPPTADVLNPMISIAQEKITQGKDETPIINTIGLENFLGHYGIHITGYSTLILLIAIITFLIFGGITITAVMINRRKMLSVKAPIIGNADLSVVKGQIKNGTDYSLPQTERPIDVVAPVDPIANQQIPPQSMPMPNIAPTTSAPTITDVYTQAPTTMPSMPDTTVSNTPTTTMPTVGQGSTPVEINGPAINTAASTSSVPVSLTSSYNSLPESQTNTPTTNSTTTPETPQSPITPSL